MNTLASPVAAPSLAPPAVPLIAASWRPVACYAVAVLACVLAAAIAGALAIPTPHLVADTELAWLLRGMGLIKASLVVAGLGVLAVRLRWPLSGRLTLAYGLCLALLSAATVWIWQLSWIPLAAAVFHLAGLVLLVLAWRDGAGLWDAHCAGRNHRA